MFDREMRYIAISRGWLEQFSLTNEIIGRRHYDVFAEIPERWKEVHRRCLQGAVETADEDRFERGDGSVQWVKWEVRPWFDTAGQVGGITIFTQDITKRKLAEEALRYQSQLTEHVVKTAAVSIFVSDARGRAVFINPEAQRVFGYSPEELQGENLHDKIHFRHPDGRPYPASECPLHRVYTQGEIVRDFEGEFYRKDGEAVSVIASNVPIFENGKLSRVVLTAQDMTERKKAERELAGSRRLLETVANNATLALFIMDARQQCVYMNPAAEELTGYTLAEVQGRALHYFVHHTRPDGSPYPLEECPIDRAFLQNNREKGTEIFVHKNGTFYPVAFTASPVREEGRPSGTIVEVRDIGEEQLRAAEREQLLQSEKRLRLEAENANQLKDQFLATLSHELRTPLTAILGWASMLRSRSLGPENERRALEAIERGAQAQAQIVDDILDVSRIVTGKLRLDIRRTNLKDIIAVSNDAIRPAAAAKSIQLRVIVDPKIRPIAADVDRMQQVMWNLLSNAVKFTPAGGVVTTRVEQTRVSTRISVSDSGPGIDPEFLPYVFDRFRQADSSTTRAHGGLGLGLAIVRHLVELHGGDVEVRSPGDNKGATFTVTLPSLAVLPRPKAPGAAHQLRPPEPLSTYESSLLKDMRVLVVDDEPDAREVIAEALKQSSADVRTADSVRAATKALQQWRPEVLVSDITMPGHDGYELIRYIRAHENEHGGHLPALALTAYGGNEDRLKALGAGYEFHLSKPVDPDELVRAVAQLVGRGL
jgi:PAS domain S-box-containing protein